jgi:hypothetical protein
MRAKTARWASRDDSKAGDGLGGRNTWLLVVVGGVSIRTPLSLCLSLVCVTGSSGPSLLHASHMRTAVVPGRVFVFFCFFVFFVFLSLFVWFFVYVSLYSAPLAMGYSTLGYRV